MLKLLSERNTKIDDESSVKIHDRELTEVSKKKCAESEEMKLQ